MNRRLLLIAVLLASVLATAVPYAAGAPSIKVQIVNNSGIGANNIWVLLTGDTSYPIQVSGITSGTSTLLSSLTNSQFTLSAITVGRLYFSYNGKVAANQQLLTPSPRFDKVEFTYPGKGNLTAVDFFGIPFKMETLDASGNVIQTLNYYTSKNTIAATLLALAPHAQVNTAVNNKLFARILSPSVLPAAYPGMQNYVNKMKGQTVTISGTYVGQIGPNPDTYNYTGTFGSQNGTIKLTGTLSAISNPQPLTVAGPTLASAIYTDNGPYLVGKTPNNVTANDVYAAIYRDLMASFSFGYMGGKYGSNSGSWYGTTPYHPAYAAARSTNDGFYNRYASILAASSDAYGFPFQDVNQTVHVDLNQAGATNVAAIRITILPDNMMDAPVISTASSTNNSITASWTAVPGATNYSVSVSPPLGAAAISTKGKTSCTIPNLKAGTPYTVLVTASSATASSPSIPVVISTKGTAPVITGKAKWNFIGYFTGTFAGHKISLNGVSGTLGSGLNPNLALNNIQGVPGQQNAYVFRWTDSKGNLIFTSILYVTLGTTVDPQGFGTIVQATTKTFMASNEWTPNYSNNFDLYLNIGPLIQRTFVSSGSLDDPEPPQFGALHAVRAGTQMLLHSTVTDGNGVRGVSVAVTTAKGDTDVYPAQLIGSQWVARIKTGGSKKLHVIVTAADDNGNIARKSYIVKPQQQ